MTQDGDNVTALGHLSSPMHIRRTHPFGAECSWRATGGGGTLKPIPNDLDMTAPRCSRRGGIVLEKGRYAG